MSQLVPGIVSIDRGERIQYLSSDKDTHFTEAIALNAIENENISGLLWNKITIREINIQAKEAMLFTVWFWGSSTLEDTDLDVDSYREFVNLDVSTSGKRIGLANQYYLSSSNLHILYEDSDGTFTLHCGLMVSAGAGKTAGVLGEIQIDIGYTPRL